MSGENERAEPAGLAADQGERLALAMEQLEQTLREPIVPVYDSRGNVIAAKRGGPIPEVPAATHVEPAPSGETAAAAAPGEASEAPRYKYAGYRIGGKFFKPEDAEREVARLRALPDQDVRELHRAGRLDEWRIANGESPDPVAAADGWKAECATPAAAAKAAALSAARPSSGEKIPRPSPEKFAAIEERRKQLIEADDLKAFEEFIHSDDFLHVMVYMAGDEAEKNGTNFRTECDLSAHEVLIQRERLCRLAEDKALQQRIVALERIAGELEQVRRASPRAYLTRHMEDTRFAERSAIEELERRIRELEARPQLRYRGIWRQGEVYQVGDWATDKGSIWHCREATQDRPGGSEAWQLALKRGRDGRDAQ